MINVTVAHYLQTLKNNHIMTEVPQHKMTNHNGGCETNNMRWVGVRMCNVDACNAARWPLVQ